MPFVVSKRGMKMLPTIMHRNSYKTGWKSESNRFSRKFYAKNLLSKNKT